MTAATFMAAVGDIRRFPDPRKLVTYLGLDPRLARFLVEDFTQYAVERKPRGRRVLLIVDEFSAIAQAGTSLVDVVERTRGFGVAAILSPQVVEGMGGPEAAARIIGSAHTILLHQVRCRRRSSRSPAPGWSWRPASNTTTAAPPAWAAPGCSTPSGWTPTRSAASPSASASPSAPVKPPPSASPARPSWRTSRSPRPRQR